MVKRKKWPWFLFCILIAPAALALLAGAYFKIDDKHEGYYFAESVTTEGTEPMAEHVYLILVDGLRADTLDKMPYTKGLADEGSSGIFTVPGPTFSRPAYARIITGACSSINGISSNNQAKKLFAPTLFDLAYGEGLKSGASAYKWYYDLLFGPPYHTGEGDENRLIRNDTLPLQYGYFYDDFDGEYDDVEIFDYGMQALVEENPNFLLVHTMDVDEMGHRHGGVSEAYLEAALVNDRCIREFIERIPDPAESVVIITGDHGHTDRGGHGGLEKKAVEIKVAFYGKGVAPGGMLEGYTQLDLAPTIAAILGLPFTSYMEGRIVSDAFTWPEGTKSAKTALLNGAHRPLLLELGRQFKVKPTENEDGLSLTRLSEAVNRRWIILRGAVGLVAFLAATLWCIRVLRQHGTSAEDKGEKRRLLYGALVPAALSLLTYSVTLYAYGFGYSYSYVNQMSDILRVPPAGVTAFAVFLIIYLLFMRKSGFGGFAFAGSCLIGATALIAAAAGILQGGVQFFLPHVTLYMIYLLTLGQLVINALLCALTGAVIALVERQRSRIPVSG